jgi:hypothetical protein
MSEQAWRQERLRRPAVAGRSPSTVSSTPPPWPIDPGAAPACRWSARATSPGRSRGRRRRCCERRGSCRDRRLQTKGRRHQATSAACHQPTAARSHGVRIFTDVLKSRTPSRSLRRSPDPGSRGGPSGTRRSRLRKKSKQRDGDSVQRRVCNAWRWWLDHIPGSPPRCFVLTSCLLVERLRDLIVPEDLRLPRREGDIRLRLVDRLHHVAHGTANRIGRSGRRGGRGAAGGCCGWRARRLGGSWCRCARGRHAARICCCGQFTRQTASSAGEIQREFGTRSAVCRRSGRSASTELESSRTGCTYHLSAHSVPWRARVHSDQPPHDILPRSVRSADPARAE